MTQVDLGLTSVGRFDSADSVISVNDVNEKPGASHGGSSRMGRETRWGVCVRVATQDVFIVGSPSR
jgi:hypothetical protein